MLEISVKNFAQLSKLELYDLLQLRSEIFVVEQDCVYQDIDGKDQKALHVLGYISQTLVAYTRLFKPNDYFENASIGRVLVKQNQRKYHYGNEIMKASITAIETEFKETKIKISAQTYLEKFYNGLGFFNVGQGYLEDGIPHIAMIRY